MQVWLREIPRRHFLKIGCLVSDLDFFDSPLVVVSNRDGEPLRRARCRMSKKVMFFTELRFWEQRRRVVHEKPLGNYSTPGAMARFWNKRREVSFLRDVYGKLTF